MATKADVFCTFVTFVSCIVSCARPVSAAAPTIIGRFARDLTGGGRDFDTRGNLGCLVTKGGDGPEFFVLGLQDPSEPTVLGALDVPGDLNRVVLRDDLAYVATSQNDRELLIVDVSDPASPQVLGGYDTQSRGAISLAVGGSLVFLGTKRAGGRPDHELHVIDVSNPSAPARLDSIDLGTDVNDLALDGDVLYAVTSDDDRELVLLDVSVPTAVSELRSVDLQGSADAEGIDVHRGLVYVVRRDQDNFVVLDANSLNQISTTQLDGRGKKVRIYRDRAYVATEGGQTGLQIVDIGDPRRPHVLHSISDASATNVHLAAPHAYLTTRRSSDGLLIVDAQSLLRPNVVVVYTDDLHSRAVDFMPQLEELASRGLTFRQSFVTTPLCGPSRASLLTGLYTHNHGAVLNTGYIGAGPGAIGSDQSTLATWLRDAGYRTGFFGKYVNAFNHKCVDGSCAVPPGWDDWQAQARGGPGHLYYDYSISNNGTLEFFGDEPEDYFTDVMAQKTLDFIERQDNRPFFAILSVNAPHLDAFVTVPPAPRHIGAFAGVIPWRPPSYDEEDLSDKPSFYAQQPRSTDPFSVFPSYGWWLDFHRQQQLEALLSVDEAIAEIVETLQRLGEDEDTVVIFTADNGYYWGEHRLWSGKGGPYEESIRVPLMVSYPRLIEPGREDETNMVLNIDFAPTIVELTGAVPDAPIDGQSYLPLLKGELVGGWRTDFLIEQYGSFASTSPGAYQGIRHTSGTYAYYLNLGEEELYDLLVDVDQMESQAYNPTYDPVRLYCQGRIQQLMTNDALRVDWPMIAKSDSIR